MHKQNAFVDVRHEKPILCHTFDHFGQYLATSDGARMQVFYFRDFMQPVAVFEVSTNCVAFDTDCENVYFYSQGKLKAFTRTHH